jgi:hypothetical protein
MFKALILSALLSVFAHASAFGLSAYWTGQYKQTTTMAGFVGWQCEYSFNGQRFWTVSRDFCPMSVPVQ